MAQWHFSKPRIPARAVVIAIAALAVPFVDTSLSSDPTTTGSALLWLLALVPAFLLAYYRGWNGAATALAAGMAALTVAVCIVLYRGAHLGENVLFPVIAAYIGIALAAGWLSEMLHSGRADAEIIALTDDLTGLPNRRRGRMYLDMAVAQATAAEPLSLVLFDLDHFKGYNDRHGHPSGDIMLRTFAEVLAAEAGDGGMAVRYGGEEFMAVISACDAEAALAFAERVRAGLGRAQQSAVEAVTASAGIATSGKDFTTANDLIVDADRALYQAKQLGRDRACVAAGTMGAPG